MNMPFLNLDARSTAEQNVKKVVTNKALELASSFARLSCMTNGGKREPADFVGVERDFFISQLTMIGAHIEALFIMGYAQIVTAIRFGFIDMADYYDRVMTEVHKPMAEHAKNAPYNAEFEAWVERVSPTPKKEDDEEEDDDQPQLPLEGAHQPRQSEPNADAPNGEVQG